jgi:hypothetical protein
MPSNSLLKDFQANSSQLNRLVTNRLNVNSLSLNDVNDSNVSPDDILLVLNTLTIKNANLYSDRIEFKVEDLQLTEWEQRPVGNTNAKYNKHYNYKNNEALDVLKNLWNDNYQGKYSFTLHSPNAHLSILTTEELFTNRYIIIKDYSVNGDLVTLYIESEEDSPPIPEIQGVGLKIVMDNNIISCNAKLKLLFSFDIFPDSENSNMYSNWCNIINDLNDTTLIDFINKKYKTMSKRITNNERIEVFQNIANITNEITELSNKLKNNLSNNPTERQLIQLRNLQVTRSSMVDHYYTIYVPPIRKARYNFPKTIYNKLNNIVKDIETSDEMLERLNNILSEMDDRIIKKVRKELNNNPNIY